MAARNPLVIVNGEIRELPAGDTVNGATGGAGGTGVGITVSDTPPSSPAHKDLWVDSTTMTLFMFYQDADGGQWVGLPGAGGNSAAARDNLIINGCFRINQREVSGTVTLAAGAFGHDRWFAGASGCVYTFALGPSGVQLNIASGSLKQVVEGSNLSTGSVCLSWAGTSQGKVAAGSFAATPVVGSSVSGTNLAVEFGPGSLSQVKLDQASAPSPFVLRNELAELTLCWRYTFRLGQKTSSPASVPGFICDAPQSTTTSGFASGRFPVTMRAVPTLSYGLDGTFSNFSVFRLQAGTYSAVTALSLNVVTNSDLFLLSVSAASGGVAGAPGYLVANAPANKFLLFEAELTA